MTAILNIVYPIGSIYMSANNVNPTVLFGGVWNQIKDRFLLAAGSTYLAGTIGGSAASELPPHAHTIPPLQISSSGGHDHTVKVSYSNTAGAKSAVFVRGSAAEGTSSTLVDIESNSGKHTHQTLATLSNTVSIENNHAGNMPPYLTVYMWKRIE